MKTLAGLLFLVLVSLPFGGQVHAQRAWCESDCLALCKRTLPPGITLSQCAAHNNCAKYRGKKCSGSTVVEKRARKHCAKKECR